MRPSTSCCVISSSVMRMLCVWAWKGSPGPQPRAFARLLGERPLAGVDLKDRKVRSHERVIVGELDLSRETAEIARLERGYHGFGVHAVGSSNRVCDKVRAVVGHRAVRAGVASSGLFVFLNE